MARTFNRKTHLCLILGIPVILFLGCREPGQVVEWPDLSSQTKPWTRWWWQGSSVTKEGITAELESMAKAGLGGVEITPIYGVIGDEENFIPYLSPEWIDHLIYTLQEATRLGLGVDMATGTGWPFGGPWVGEDDACKYIAWKKFELEAGEKPGERIIYPENGFVRAVSNQVYQLYGIYRDKNVPVTGSWDQPELLAGVKELSLDDLVMPVSANPDLQGKALDQVRFNQNLPLEALMAYGPDQQVLDLTDQVNAEGYLDWTAPAGHWTLYAIFQGWHGKMVERAAPGGEGNVIDHFSAEAIRHYLQQFDSAFADTDLKGLRAFFNDSYEVDDARGQANWTPDFFEEFLRRRGYDLKEHFPALAGDDRQGDQARVLSDFRETFSDLILETFTQEWSGWAKAKGKIIRNQSHGSPANILDLYAASDIPETEGTEELRIKFASSAAHVAGHSLTSAEAATWLNEHFLSNLSDVKQNMDRYLVGGVNHLFYHGTCYSPPGDPWPGRLFYAAIHNNNRNPLWHDWPVLNNYIARVQSFLQAGRPDNDILLYFPMYDRFATPGDELLEHFDGHGATIEGTPLEHTALFLQDQGYSFDFISDRQILNLELIQDKIMTNGNEYQTIVVPPCRFMPLAVMKKLYSLAEAGASIIFHHELPASVPGLSNLAANQSEFNAITEKFDFTDGSFEIGAGQILLHDDLGNLLRMAGVERENIVDHDLEFIRRKWNHRHIYFITNWSGKNFEGWMELSKETRKAVIMDPMTGAKGLARLQEGDNNRVYLQLMQGQGLFVVTGEDITEPDGWHYYREGPEQISIAGEWTVQFLEGGPDLPDEIRTRQLTSWSSLEGTYRSFSGRAKYSIEFVKPEFGEAGWILDLGEVRESARVWLNGQEIGTLSGPVYQLFLEEKWIKEKNLLEIEVSNLMANRIIDMDKNNIYWKRFYNVNFPPRRAENRGKNGLFDASAWEPLPSGLIGPVKIMEAVPPAF